MVNLQSLSEKLFNEATRPSKDIDDGVLKSGRDDKNLLLKRKSLNASNPEAVIHNDSYFNEGRQLTDEQIRSGAESLEDALKIQRFLADVTDNLELRNLVQQETDQYGEVIAKLKSFKGGGCESDPDRKKASLELFKAAYTFETNDKEFQTFADEKWQKNEENGEPIMDTAIKAHNAINDAENFAHDAHLRINDIVLHDSPININLPLKPRNNTNKPTP